MHCIAREQKTTYCVIFCNTSHEAAREFNKLNKEHSFSQELQEDLIKRMEVPQLKSTLLFMKIAGTYLYSKGDRMNLHLFKK